ncbi:MAG: cation-transporting P-type ATPase [Nanoarchaeota archaeon]|nr:cation-transporting P-type ATPase [Nanoarchaeota archaeon]MBU0978183.1 cation-transporting P-type ATPase [Nanoarchaeota archaeon]
MENGLTTNEVKKLMGRYGKNEIQRTKKAQPLKIFLAQFTSPLIIILIIAAIVSYALGRFSGGESTSADSILILLIVILSGLFGFFQDYKAEKTIESLQKMTVPKADVIRNGQEMRISSTELVPGDLVILGEGGVIPADAKLIESFSMQVDESILTGESKAVSKKSSDEVYMNTYVINGHGKALVTKTGMNAKVGEIASKLQEIKEEKTLFQKEISSLSRKILWGILAIIVVVGIVGYFRYGLYLSLFTSISLAVAAIPEGLPAVIVLTLVAGSKVMWKKNALIRKLSVTESIGSIDIICTDKTGTLTKNEMSVTKLFISGKTFEADNLTLGPNRGGWSGRWTVGDKRTNMTERSKLNKNEVNKLVLYGALCNNATSTLNDKGKKEHLGDQTEVALIKLAEDLGLAKEILSEYKKLSEIPFSSKRKMMSVVCEYKNSKAMYSKGAPEILLEKCSKIYHNGRTINLTTATKKKILEKNKEFASQSLRVLGFAFKEVKDIKAKEEKLIWLGLQAMKDPPRKEVKHAIKSCENAGIRVIMMTGDNMITAKAIANEIELKTGGALNGDELDKISNKELEEKLDSGFNIFARVSPFHKLRILEILKQKYRVAMTGDGVNDALALKRADVGISMELRGTDVAKQASDIVLLDDNFASIPLAVKEGRRIFDNIQKFINYLFVSNLAEVAVLFIATLFLTLKEPILLPIQLLWVNLLTDGLPALALGVDPEKPGIMSRPPRKKHQGIIDKKMGWLIGLIGAQKTIILFATFFLILPVGLDKARTTLFTGFILYEFVRIASIRHQDKLSWLSNKWLVAALLFSIALQVAIIYSPLNTFFHIVPLGFYSWSILISGVIIGYIITIIITNIVQKRVKD